jgi:glycosyltransferase involved in cell wall biosynthesis
MNRAINQVDPQSFDERAAPAQHHSGAEESGPESGIRSELADELAALERIEDDSVFEARWAVLNALYPEHIEMWAARAQRLIRHKQFDEAVDFIASRDFDRLDADGLTMQAGLLYDARAHDQAAEIFGDLIPSYPDRRDIRMAYAKRLFADGFLVEAYGLVRAISDTLVEGTKSLALWERAVATFDLLSKLEGGAVAGGQDARITAMKHAILHFRDREVPPKVLDRLGRLTLVTGSLGAGGAERQLTRLAIELERARNTSGSVAGIPLDRPVEILVRSHGSEKQNDFYLAELQSAGVELRQINQFESVSARSLGVTDPDLLTLLDYLPPSVNYGVKRLAQYLRESGTDTVSAWQDGACLFVGLAALIAGVPQIQFAIRGLPPSMRQHMFRPEYEVLYRAMAQIPGVSFVSNNVSAARAYADWLDIPLNRFSIVYNGVEPMHAKPSPSCEEQWRQFLARTPEATETIGGVFRFDTDKQPLLWIRFARRYLKRHPKSRFVLVGDGRLLPNARELADEYGISDRILFTGRSSRVGFWMSKMDALVLLSRYEGLPNVLIEAQYMGVRVVTTPAGGAAECLIDGVTGHVLECAEKPDYENLIARVHDLALNSWNREMFVEGGLGRKFLDSRFSVSHMLAQFVTCTVRGLGSDICPTQSSEPSRQAA